ELRERTGAGMMDCKKALVDAGGNLDDAADLLRKSGQAKADKKAGRTAAEGRVVIASDDRQAVIVEINSETDFVAKDENFAAFAQAVADAVLRGEATDVEALAGETLADGRTIEAARTDLVAKVGENISLRRFARLPADGTLGTYSHLDRIGVLVALEGGNPDLAREVAMHVAAANPACIDEDGVPGELLERERRIFAEQAAQSGKPAAIAERMVSGRVAKFLKEITLLGQPFVRDPDITVGQLVARAGAKIRGFVRFEVGEGIAKKQENFAQEVMAQINQRA
ncbi:MAG: translation elongation factor Ts, partial [Woeseiaceae bacterium]